MVHEKRAASAGFAEMGLDEEKTVLGEEIVSEQVNPSSIYFACGILRKMVVWLGQKSVVFNFETSSDWPIKRYMYCENHNFAARLMWS